MESYRRVEKPKPELPISENEIRITTQGAIRNYISYATTQLQWEYRGKPENLKCTDKDIELVLGEWAEHVMKFGEGHPV